MPKPIKPRPRLKTPAIDLLSANLLRLRTERGWTQEELAYEAGLHRTFIGHVERKGRNPSLETIETIAAALKVPMTELFKVPDKSGD
jgi:transcriptional regulator with XRE-family HTH domain